MRRNALGLSLAALCGTLLGGAPVSSAASMHRQNNTSFAPATSPRSAVTFGRMTCEYLENPLGIDTTKPRFSWIEISSEKDYLQSAFRLLVSSSPKALEAGVGDLWDSGKIRSSDTLLIPYKGVALKSRMQCWWAVQVWDARGRLSAWSAPATFSIGLLSPRDWKAAWIGKDVRASHSDLSALTGAKWIWLPGIAQPSAAAPIESALFRTTVDVPAGRAIKRARFVGTADNKFTLYVNGKAAGKSADWYRLQTIDVTRLIHVGANALAVEARNVGDGGPNPAGLIGALKIEYHDGGASVIRTGTEWKSSRTAGAEWNTSDYDDRAWQPAAEIGAYGIPPWGDVTLSDAARHPDLPARYLRREFNANKRIEKAVAYVCGLGFFRLYVNGRPATDHVMDPALSDYRKAAYYVSMDVTPLMRKGANAVAVVLGNGRFHAPRLSVPITTATFGAPRVLFQLEITYADGTRATVVSDRSWKATDRGPIRANNEYDGETYDARMEPAGWTLPGFSPAGKRWAPADIMAAPGGALRAQMMEPMRVTGLVRPVKITSPKPGVYVVDMGRTFYGTVRLKAHGKRGTTVRMTAAYALLPDGTLKTADNRSALATDNYTFAGHGEETWNPVFRGQGYRRIQVVGFPGKPTVRNFEGLIEQSDTRPVGSFSCSNDLVNRIHDAMRTGMTMFLRSAPLDPDRDERQPWMGDPAKDSESEAYNFDVAAFYTKWMDDVHRSQRPDGSIPDVSMYWEMGNGVEWPSVFTIIPDWYTGFYADAGLEKRHYEAMKRWVLAMRAQHALPDGTLQGVGYGDWCDAYTIGGKVGDNGLTPLDLVATAYQYNNVRIVQRAAERLGKTDEAVTWRAMGDGLYRAFMDRFFDPAACTYTGGTQCSYVLPLAFGLTPSDPAKRQAVVDNLVRDIMVTHGGHLTVGLIGNQWLLQVLTQCGRADVAWRIVTQTTKPGWGYMIERGSNTIWERWDYDTRDPGMNSEALLIQAGNADAWFYQTLGGIDYDPQRPGFAHILIQPHMLGDLKWVKCRFDSPHGTIVSDWVRDGANATMQITIPANTTATVTTPDGIVHQMTSGRWTLKSRVN